MVLSVSHFILFGSSSLFVPIIMNLKAQGIEATLLCVGSKGVFLEL